MRKPKKLYMDTNTPMPRNAVANNATSCGLRRWPSIAASSDPNRIFFGWKRRWWGSSTAMTSAIASATLELTSTATRQSTSSSMPAGMRRPVSPPTVVPAT